MNWTQRLKQLAEARQAKAEVDAARAQALADWEARYSTAIAEREAITRLFAESCAEAEATLAELDAEIRADAVEHYKATGEREFPKGLEVKIFTVLEYDPTTALEWAKEHKLCLSLDKRSFEAIAKKEPMEFVSVTEDPRAQIGTDLTAYLDNTESASARR